MSYPEEIKQKAIELRPGRSAGDVLKNLAKVFPNDDLPDARTIRRWVRNQTELGGQETNCKYVSEHFRKLTDLANVLLSDDLRRVTKWTDPTGKVEYHLFDQTECHLQKRLTEDDLSCKLEDNLHKVYLEYTEWFYKSCFLPHLFAEWPEEFRNKISNALLYKQPYSLIETLRILAERKNFKGDCPVCRGLFDANETNRSKI